MENKPFKRATTLGIVTTILSGEANFAGRLGPESGIYSGKKYENTVGNS